MIDHSDPGSWADALRFPPFIEDRDGVLFNRAFISPDTRLKCPLNAGEGGEQPVPAFAPVRLLSLHAERDATTVKDNPRER